MATNAADLPMSQNKGPGAQMVITVSFGNFTLSSRQMNFSNTCSFLPMEFGSILPNFVPNLAVPPTKPKGRDDEAFQQLLKQLQTNDPNLTRVDLKEFQLDNSRFVQVVKALGENTQVRRLLASSYNSARRLGIESAVALRELLEKTNTLEVLYIGNNNFDVKGAQEIMEGIRRNNSLWDIDVKNNPFLDDEPTLRAFEATILSKPKLVEGIKNYYLLTLKQLQDIKPKKTVSTDKLLECLTENPKDFYRLYCCTCKKKSGQYSKLDECYCRSELSRLMDISDYRTISENAIVESFVTQFPNQDSVIRGASAGAGTLLPDAIILAKLFKAGFKHIEWTPIDLCFDNQKLLFDLDYDNVIVVYQFMKLMRDLGIRVVNNMFSSISHRNLTQEIAFQFLRETSQPVKHPRGTLTLGLMGSALEYQTALARFPARMPHALLSIDLNRPCVSNYIKSFMRDGVVYFDLSKFSADPDDDEFDSIKIEMQKKAGGKWHSVIPIGQFNQKITESTANVSIHQRVLVRRKPGEEFVSNPLLFRDIYLARDAAAFERKAGAEKHRVPGMLSLSRMAGVEKVLPEGPGEEATPTPTPTQQSVKRVYSPDAGRRRRHSF